MDRARDGEITRCTEWCSTRGSTSRPLCYVGSLTVDAQLMQAADLLPGERVQVVDLNDGARLETYVTEGHPAAASPGGRRSDSKIVSRGARQRTGLVIAGPVWLFGEG